MIDFTEKARISKEANEVLSNILSKSDDRFEQYKEIGKITDLGIAKVVIERLIDKLN